MIVNIPHNLAIASEVRNDSEQLNIVQFKIPSLTKLPMSYAGSFPLARPIHSVIV